MPEVLRVEAAPAADVVPVAAAAAAAPAAVAGTMRWNNKTSRPDKVFKDKDVNHVAKCLKDYSGDAVSPTQDSDVKEIMLDGEHYLGHYKDHPKDAKFLNSPIRFYPKMEAIFGHSMATGRYALGSGEALGVNQAKSATTKVEGSAFHHFPKKETNTKVDEGSKATELLQSTMGGKRKRENFTEDEMLMLTNMSDAVNNVANALRETRPAYVDANLYLVVMETPVFSKEALIAAYTYLLDTYLLA
ncbi:unnamed protein product [Miscanthus lutarioriparius]|uniref:Uncharacterized protein n=1 Tax=Miscanthus lutarioriparius TaxID=422564 RepID=A0A811P0X3_9POAL|nr:unnamed protein product [Miscanthus lutarioriparius]